MTAALWLLTACWLGTAGPLPSEIILDNPDYWEDRGFVQLVPPVRLPTTHDGSDRIEVWLFVPPPGELDARIVLGEGMSLVYPPGTRLDRVERKVHDGGSTIMDVRGTWLNADGEQQFHVLRPTEDEDELLTGWSWMRGDQEARREAERQMVEHVTRHVQPPLDRPMTREEARGLLEFNDCGSCHMAYKPAKDEVDDPGRNRRPTDAAGFYLPMAVLDGWQPLSSTRPNDPNVDDPWVEVRCPEGEPQVERDDAGARYVCPDDGVPEGRRRIRAALDAGDEYTQQVCAARRYLHDHLDSSAREHFADAFGQCGL